MEGEVAGVHFGCPGELSGVSKECGFMIMGELMGLLRNIRTLLGDWSQFYCGCLLGGISHGIVDILGCFEGFQHFRW